MLASLLGGRHCEVRSKLTLENDVMNEIALIDEKSISQ